MKTFPQRDNQVQRHKEWCCGSAVMTCIRSFPCPLVIINISETKKKKKPDCLSVPLEMEKEGCGPSDGNNKRF